MEDDLLQKLRQMEVEADTGRRGALQVAQQTKVWAAIVSNASAISIQMSKPAYSNNEAGGFPFAAGLSGMGMGWGLWHSMITNLCLLHSSLAPSGGPKSAWRHGCASFALTTQCLSHMRSQGFLLDYEHGLGLPEGQTAEPPFLHSHCLAGQATAVSQLLGSSRIDGQVRTQSLQKP